MCHNLKHSNSGFVLYMLYCPCRLVIYMKFAHGSRTQIEQQSAYVQLSCLTMYLQPILCISTPDDKHVGLVSYVVKKRTFRYIHKNQYIEVIKSNILFMLLIRFITKIRQTKLMDLQLLYRTVFQDMKLIIHHLKSAT